VDKWWIIVAADFIHRLHTGTWQGMHLVLAPVFMFKQLIYKVIKKLSTGALAPNNNNKITISNLY
jgi:hypothetical protein